MASESLLRLITWYKNLIFIQRDLFFFTMAIRIRLKGPLDLKALVPENWFISDLISYLPELLSMDEIPLVYKNHKIFELDSEEKVCSYIQKTFDCHFVKKKVLYTLKIEKLVNAPEDILLPLNLYANL